MKINTTTCEWVPLDNKSYKEYHDKEWGVPVHDDKLLFELLILEGAQAGLSWATILHKRESYREAFDNFDFNKVADYDNQKISELLSNKGIVRNKLKINSAIKNARIFKHIRTEYGTFNNYLWGFTNHKSIVNNWKSNSEMPVKSELSEQISKDLKKKGMTFVGPTIIYSYLQSAGLINDHLITCFRYKEIISLY